MYGKVGWEPFCDFLFTMYLLLLLFVVTYCSSKLEGSGSYLRLLDLFV